MESIATAAMYKAAILEEANMLMLMTLPDSPVTSPEAIEYLRLRWGEELKKLQWWLVEDVAREANLLASTASLPTYTNKQRNCKLAALGVSRSVSGTSREAGRSRASMEISWHFSISREYEGHYDDDQDHHHEG
jgi:hypothetical protein